MTRWSGPRWSGDLPDQPDRPKPAATISYERANGDRRHLTLNADTTAELDRLIIARLPDLRAGGNRIVKTVLTFSGEEWTYEYNSVGEIERVFRNGEVTP